MTARRCPAGGGNPGAGVTARKNLDAQRLGNPGAVRKQNPPVPENGAGLPELIERARTQLDAACTSAEVLAARAVAQAALHYARQCEASHETLGAVLMMLKRSEIRMADEIKIRRSRVEVIRWTDR